MPQDLPPGFQLDNGSAVAPPPRAPGIIQGRPKQPEPIKPPSGYTFDGNGGLVPIPGGPADPNAEPDKAPSGYRYKPDGSLEPIPGGPATKPRDGGAIPVSAANAIRPGTAALVALQRARDTFKDDYAGNVFGGLENTMQSYTPEMFGTVGTPGQAQWWSDFRKTDNLERNELFGATLTPGEKQAYAETTITPGMTASEVRANLDRRYEIVKNALEKEKEFYLANGYKPEAVEALFSPLNRGQVVPRDVEEIVESDGSISFRVTDESRRDSEGRVLYDENGNMLMEWQDYTGPTFYDDGSEGPFVGRVSDETPPSGGGGGASEMLGTSLGNTLIGYAQGAGEALVDFPLTIGNVPSVAFNSLIDAGRAAYSEATGDQVGAQQIRARRERLNEQSWQRSTPVANVFNALLPAPQGYETQRDVARFAGGFLVPGPKGARPAPRAPSPAAPAAAPARGVIPNAAEIVAEGQRRGVPVKTTDIKPPQSGMGRFVKQTLPEKIPIAGMSGPRAAQQTARVEAVKQVVQDYGGTVGREMFDNSPKAAEDIARTLGNERSRRLTNLTQAKDSVIDGVQQPFTVAPNTVRAISEQVRKLQGIDPQEFAPVIERLQRFGERVTAGASLRTVEEQRRLLGELFTDPNLARIKGQGEKAINAIYKPLRDDMGNFIEANAGKAARVKWERSNEGLAAMAGELKSARFRNVLRDADVTPEAVNRILFQDMGNVSDMQRLVSNLPRSGKAKVKTALIQKAFDDANGAEGVSVERFIGNIERLSGKIGVAFEPAERQGIEGMRRLMDATRRASAAGANIRTGEQNLPAVMGVGATQLLGGVGGVGTLGVGGLLARLYESPAMRDRFIKLSRTRPGSPQEARMTEIIMRSAVPIVNEWRANLPVALNDNAAGRLAAEEQQPSEPQ